MNMIKSGSNWR